MVGKKMMSCKIPSTFISFGFGFGPTVIVLTQVLFFQLLSKPNVSSEKVPDVEKIEKFKQQHVIYKTIPTALEESLKADIKLLLAI